MARRNQLLQDQEVQLRPIDFESFYRQRADGVYRALASTLRDVDLAQEATAEAMVRTFQRWDKIRHYDNPAGWAYRVGLNWATSRLRRRSRDRTRRSHVGTFGPARPDQPTVFDPELQEALRVLDMPQRAVIVLRYLLDLSQDEIAEALDVPVGTVKSRLNRGLTRLREVMAA